MLTREVVGGSPGFQPGALLARSNFVRGEERTGASKELASIVPYSKNKIITFYSANTFMG